MSLSGTGQPTSVKKPVFQGRTSLAKGAQRSQGLGVRGRVWTAEAQASTSTPRPGLGASPAGGELGLYYIFHVFVLNNRYFRLHGGFLNSSKSRFSRVSSLTLTLSKGTLLNSQRATGTVRIAVKGSPQWLSLSRLNIARGFSGPLTGVGLPIRSLPVITMTGIFGRL